MADDIPHFPKVKVDRSLVTSYTAVSHSFWLESKTNTWGKVSFHHLALHSYVNQPEGGFSDETDQDRVSFTFDVMAKTCRW